jgi:hypothetical protein
MSEVVEAPVEVLEAIATFRLPTKTDCLLQRLMAKNTEDGLKPSEREELEALVELSEAISLLRAKALRALQRSPA